MTESKVLVARCTIVRASVMVGTDGVPPLGKTFWGRYEATTPARKSAERHKAREALKISTRTILIAFEDMITILAR